MKRIAPILTSIGSIVALIGFALPWASCTGKPIASGLAIASRQYEWTDQGGLETTLFLIPSVALIALGLSIRSLTASSKRTNIPPFQIWPRAIILLTALPTLALAIFACVFIAIVPEGPNPEHGLLVTPFGIALVIVGVLVSFLPSGTISPTDSSPPPS